MLFQRGLEELKRVLVVLHLVQQQPDRERQVAVAGDGVVAVVCLIEGVAQVLLHGRIGLADALQQAAR